MAHLSLPELARVIPAVLVGLTIHELAHAWVAVLLGDDTPREMGRLTLNPLKHIDPIGAILLLVAGFGWAKPVVIDRARLSRPLRDDLLISVAGPISNFLLAILLVVALRLTMAPGVVPEAAVRPLFETAIVFIWINLGLGLFNLLPIPPLDGSHLVTGLLDRRSPGAARRFRQVGPVALLAIVLLDRISGSDLLSIGRAITAIGRGMLALARVI